VIGAGRIAEEHLKFLRDSRRAAPAAICDLSRATAGYAARKYGFPEVHTSVAHMLESVRPDIVHLLTPPHTHVPLAELCLKHDAHLIVEKPVAPSRQDFQALWELAQDRGKVLVEDHNYRFNRQIREIDCLLAEGVLGELREVEIRMVLNIHSGGRYADRDFPDPAHKLPGGVVQDYLTHFSYLMLHFMPSVDRLAAAWSRHSGNEVFKYDDLDVMLIGGDVHGRIRFTSHQAPDCITIAVRGARGFVETDFFHPYRRLVIPRRGPAQLSMIADHILNGMSLSWWGVRNFKNKLLQRNAYDGLHRCLDETYAAIQEHREPPVTFNDMDDCLALVERILAEEHRI
jgi:predicted dehydrogenase